MHLEGARGAESIVFLEEPPLLLFVVTFLLFLPADILTNHFFVKSDGTYSIASRPQMAAPILPPQLGIACELPYQASNLLVDILTNFAPKDPVSILWTKDDVIFTLIERVREFLEPLAHNVSP